MCGRFNLIATPDKCGLEFGLDYLAEYETSYNIPPGQAILNITQLPDGSLQASYAHWGLVPSWSKDRKIASHLINARAETLSEKPSFRVAYKKRRCLISSYAKSKYLRQSRRLVNVNRSKRVKMCAT